MTSAQKLQVGAGAVCAKARGVWATLRYCDIAHTLRATQRHKSCFEAPQGVPYIHIYIVYRMLLLATWFLLALAELQQCALPVFSSYLTSSREMKWKLPLSRGVRVCSLICLVLGRNRQPHRIDFVNCSLFAFHSGLVELSAVISVIALPFSVNTRARLPYPPPPPLGNYMLTICCIFNRKLCTTLQHHHIRHICVRVLCLCLLSCIIALFIQC